MAVRFNPDIGNSRQPITQQARKLFGKRWSLGLHELFVFGAWLCMAAALWAFVFVFGSPLPYYDDIAILASWANRGAATWEWFFQPWNGHVIPFARAAIVSCWTLTDGNLRPVLLCSTGILIVASLWVLIELRRMTERLTAEDCLIPLAMLGCHAYSDAIWAINWNNVVAAGFTAIISAIVLRKGIELVPCGVGWLAAATGLLAFQGGSGLLGAIGFIPALGLLAWRSTKGQPGRMTHAVLTMSLLIAVVTGLLALGIIARPHVDATRASTQSLVGSLVRMIRPVALPAGWLSIRAWPLGLAIIIVAMGAVIWGAFHTRRRHPRAMIIVLTLLPALLVCAGLAVSRKGLLHPRYIGMVVPLWIPIHFGLQLAVAPNTRRLIRLAALFVLAGSFGYGLTPTFKEGRSRINESRLLLASINDGLSFDQLAASHAHAWGQRQIARQFAENLSAISRLGKSDIARIPAHPVLTFMQPVTPSKPTDDRAKLNLCWRCEAGGVMQIPLADKKVDAVRLVIDTANAIYGLRIGIGAIRIPSQTWKTEAYEDRMTFPDEETVTGERPVYTVTYLLPPDATSVVLVAPPGCGDIGLRRVEYGYLEYE